MEWLKRSSQAIAYIERNLTGEIAYGEAANIACCSTYIFQRMFSKIIIIKVYLTKAKRRFEITFNPSFPFHKD